MLFLNKFSNTVIDRIIAMADGQTAFKINNAPGSFMALHVELLPEVFIPALGMCQNLSLSHYGECNGDLMRDPEMCFLQAPNGQRFAYYFRNDWAGTETSALEWESKALSPGLIEDMNDFAQMWLRNIAEQQELKSVRLSA